MEGFKWWFEPGFTDEVLYRLSTAVEFIDSGEPGYAKEELATLLRVFHGYCYQE